jgi:hypothetical protein
MPFFWSGRRASTSGKGSANLFGSLQVACVPEVGSGLRYVPPGLTISLYSRSTEHHQSPSRPWAYCCFTAPAGHVGASTAGSLSSACGVIV